VSIDIDPQQLAVTELRDIDLRQVDFTVVAVGIEEPGRDGVQRTRASSPAAITAMAAVRYCSASIARSEAGSASSIRNGLWVLSVSIDLDPRVGDVVSTPGVQRMLIREPIRRYRDGPEAHHARVTTATASRLQASARTGAGRPSRARP
jgi:hypothetical protein